jgi:hypothetical protein
LKTKGKNYFRLILILLLAALLVPVGYVLVVRLEGEQPTIEITPQLTAIGAGQKVTVLAADQRSGLRKIWIAILKDGKETVIHQSELPSAGVLSGGQVNQKTLQLTIDPRSLGIPDGNAMVRMGVWDYSWRGWWHGNRAYVEKEVVIDTRPPEISVLTRIHNITQGGSGVTVYRLSEDCRRSGVTVGEHFYPGHAGYFSDPDIFLAFFALRHNQGPGTDLAIEAEDRAGNSARAGFPHHIRKKRFKKDTIRISDRFLNWKMPEFGSDVGDRSPGSPMDTFLIVNRELRKANTASIKSVCRNHDPVWHWEGRFLRLPAAANRAGFADHRTYTYNGEQIDTQYHMGVDLASVAHSPIPAANAGKVAFSGRVGIYGQTAIIDHGYGLFSMYSHLSQIDVVPGQHVAKGDPIGRTGLTGLAGGDHLHFAMLVHDTFVNPVEWWDAVWIRHNITEKIDTIAATMPLAPAGTNSS